MVSPANAVAPVGLAAKTAHGLGIDSPIPVPSVVIGPYWDQAWIGER